MIVDVVNQATDKSQAVPNEPMMLEHPQNEPMMIEVSELSEFLRLSQENLEVSKPTISPTDYPSKIPCQASDEALVSSLLYSPATASPVRSPTATQAEISSDFIEPLMLPGQQSAGMWPATEAMGFPIWWPATDAMGFPLAVPEVWPMCWPEFGQIAGQIASELEHFWHMPHQMPENCPSMESNVEPPPPAHAPVIPDSTAEKCSGEDDTPAARVSNASRSSVSTEAGASGTSSTSEDECSALENDGMKKGKELLAMLQENPDNSYVSPVNERPELMSIDVTQPLSTGSGKVNAKRKLPPAPAGPAPPPPPPGLDFTDPLTPPGLEYMGEPSSETSAKVNCEVELDVEVVVASEAVLEEDVSIATEVSATESGDVLAGVEAVATRAIPELQISVPVTPKVAARKGSKPQTKPQGKKQRPTPTSAAPSPAGRSAAPESPVEASVTVTPTKARPELRVAARSKTQAKTESPLAQQPSEKYLPKRGTETGKKAVKKQVPWHLLAIVVFNALLVFALLIPVHMGGSAERTAATAVVAGTSHAWTAAMPAGESLHLLKQPVSSVVRNMDVELARAHAIAKDMKSKLSSMRKKMKKAKKARKASRQNKAPIGYYEQSW
jgi:hypothetical protein